MQYEDVLQRTARLLMRRARWVRRRTLLLQALFIGLCICLALAVWHRFAPLPINQDWVIGNGANPWLWVDGVRTSLNRLLTPGDGWLLDSVTALNDNGQIVGTGCTPSECSGVRLDPTSAVPDPKRAVLLLAGLVVLLVRRAWITACVTGPREA